MKRVNKWKTIFVIKAMTNYGREDIDTFDSYSETRKMLIEYRIAMPSTALYIVRRRVLNDGSN